MLIEKSDNEKTGVPGESAIRNPQSTIGTSAIRNPQSANEAAAGVRLRRALVLLAAVLVVSTLVALWVGYQRLDLLALRTDDRARLIFFELRLPRVVMAGVGGAALGGVGAGRPGVVRKPPAGAFAAGG